MHTPKVTKQTQNEKDKGLRDPQPQATKQAPPEKEAFARYDNIDDNVEEWNEQENAEYWEWRVGDPTEEYADRPDPTHKEVWTNSTKGFNENVKLTLSPKTLAAQYSPLQIQKQASPEKEAHQEDTPSWAEQPSDDTSNWLKYREDYQGNPYPDRVELPWWEQIDGLVRTPKKEKELPDPFRSDYKKLTRENYYGYTESDYTSDDDSIWREHHMIEQHNKLTRQVRINAITPNDLRNYHYNTTN